MIATTRRLRSLRSLIAAAAWLAASSAGFAQAAGWPVPIERLQAKVPFPDFLQFNCARTKFGARLWMQGAVSSATPDRSGDGARFRQAFDACLAQAGSGSIEVRMWSPGGSVDEGLEVGRHIASAGSRASTYLERGTKCISICTVAFLGGAVRVIHPTAEYTVHSFGAPGLATGLTLMTKCMRLEAIWQLSAPDRRSGVPVQEGCDPHQKEIFSNGIDNKESDGNTESARRVFKADPVDARVASADALVSQIVSVQRSSARTMLNLVRFLDTRKVDTDRLLDQWLSVTLKNVRTLSQREIFELGVAAVQDLD